jgi:hypothetical protein
LIEEQGLKLNPKEDAMVVKLDNIETLDQMMIYTQKLVDSNILPFSSPEKALVAYQTGKELGLGIITAMNNIHVISGKPSLSVHAALALGKKANVVLETVEDYEVYEVEFEDKEGNKKKASTRRTTIIFHHMWNGVHMKEKMSFTMADAKKAGWADKDNWKKMPKIMLWNRTAVIGIRRVAPDALLGMYEASEVADFSNVTIDLDAEGNPINQSQP